MYVATQSPVQDKIKMAVAAIMCSFATVSGTVAVFVTQANFA